MTEAGEQRIEKGSLLVAIQKLSEKWRKKLTDTGRRNSALYFKHLKAGTLHLPDLPNEAILRLVDSGKPLDLTEILRVDAGLSKTDKYRQGQGERE